MTMWHYVGLAYGSTALIFLLNIFFVYREKKHTKKLKSKHEPKT